MSLKNFEKQMNKITCESNATVLDVAKMMKEQNVGTVLVSEDGKPQGFITDRDLVVRCLTNGSDLSGLNSMQVSQVMSQPVYTIHEEASILDLIEEMGEKKVRRICVVDEAKKAVGVISMADIFELLSHEIGALGKALGERKHKLFRRSEKMEGVA